MLSIPMTFLDVDPDCSGWYDSVYDEELGCQPCIFTSATPVCSVHRFVSDRSLTYSVSRPGIIQI
jgi:hypothetical protein